MADAPPPELSNAVHPHGDADALHPDDRAFLAQTFAGGPLIFGLIALASSVLILGMIPGALGLRAGLDLWQRGVRRGVVIAGMLASFTGVVASIIAALLWGALLAGVLLGRDAMRETERWRGEIVTPFVLPATESISGEVFEYAVPPTDAKVERLAIVLAGVGEQPSAEAIATAVSVVQRHPSCRLLIVTPLASREEGLKFANLAATATAVAVVGGDAALPAPLASVAAFPTTVIMDREGRIEFALVGTRGEEELERLFSGEAARAAAEREKALQDSSKRPTTPHSTPDRE